MEENSSPASSACPSPFERQSTTNYRKKLFQELLVKRNILKNLSNCNNNAEIEVLKFPAEFIWLTKDKLFGDMVSCHLTELSEKRKTAIKFQVATNYPHVFTSGNVNPGTSSACLDPLCISNKSCSFNLEMSQSRE